MIPNAAQIAETIAESRNLNLDTATAVANATLDCSDHLLALTLGTWRSLLVELGTNANTVTDVKEVGELIKLETALGWRLIDKNTESARIAFEIVAQCQQTTLDLIELRISAFTRDLVARVEDAAGSVKPGSNLAFAAVMSGLEVARGATEATETTEATSDSETEASAASRRAARKSA